LKFLPSLTLTKIDHFSKVSPGTLQTPFFKKHYSNR
jgi:hypothetical protein